MINLKYIPLITIMLCIIYNYVDANTRDSAWHRQQQEEEIRNKMFYDNYYHHMLFRLFLIIGAIAILCDIIRYLYLKNLK